MVARSGVDFPGSAAARDVWFPDDEACLDYLDLLRWAQGFRCPHCGGRASWRLVDGRRSCASCARRTSPTAGTLLHRSRSPLPVWFAAAWALTEGGDTSAAGLQRDLGLPSYQTAWTMLHRYRRAMAGAGPRLRGVVDAAIVELDASLGSGPSPLLVVAVEHRTAALGRCRVGLVSHDPAAAVRRLLADAMGPGVELRAGGPSWRSFLAPAGDLGLQVHPGSGPVSPAGAAAGDVAVAVGGWLAGPLRGAVRVAHLPAYLDEFSFRFDGGRGAPPGVLFHRLLRQVVVTPPVQASQLVAAPAPRASPPSPPHPRREPHVRQVTSGADHPWRRS